MKKKLMVFLCAMALTFSVSVTGLAADSPTGDVLDDTGDRIDDEKDKNKDKAPQTGEGQWVIYGLATAVLLSGTAVVAQKQLKKIK